MGISEILLSLAAPTVTGLLLVAGQRILSRSQKEISRGPEWNSFAQRQQDHWSEVVAEAKAGEDEERTRRQEVQRKYRLSLSSLRGITVRHPEERERLPPDVRNDL